MKDLNSDNITGKNNSGKRSNNPSKRLTASSITGDNVFNPRGDALGKISDIMIDFMDGRVDYVIIEFGGPLRTNPKYFAVPFEALAIYVDRKHAFILGESRESLKRYPSYVKDHWSGTKVPTRSTCFSGPSHSNGVKTGGESIQTLKLPVYLNCRFFQNERDHIYAFKIDASGIAPHPFQLFKMINDGSCSWENLSVYASPDDAIMVLLKELFTTELAEEVDHGQARVNPTGIMEKIKRGERSVSLYSSAEHEMFRLDFDVNFEDLIERK